MVTSIILSWLDEGSVYMSGKWLIEILWLPEYALTLDIITWIAIELYTRATHMKDSTVVLLDDFRVNEIHSKIVQEHRAGSQLGLVISVLKYSECPEDIAIDKFYGKASGGSGLDCATAVDVGLHCHSSGPIGGFSKILLDNDKPSSYLIGGNALRSALEGTRKVQIQHTPNSKRAPSSNSSNKYLAADDQMKFDTVELVQRLCSTAPGHG
ncbi:hypothetical protein EV361DRAFT_988719 [Lentinula raphanica]|nr:hypothetical protein EV361DRAFT_988719 [Lentinula raphanica]